MRRTRVQQRGAVLFGVAGGMFVAAGGLVGAYYVAGNTAHGEVRPSPRGSAAEAATVAAPDKSLLAFADTPVSVTVLTAKHSLTHAGAATAQVTWADLGVELDPDEVKRVGDANVATLAAKGELPIKVDRDKAIAELMKLKAHYDRSPIDAYLDLEARVIHDDTPGQGVDVWASLPRIEAAARQGAATLELADVPIPATVTKAKLGIDDISHVLGHYMTRYSVGDRDRDFNLKLAASKINGTVLAPGQQWSFNDAVGPRTENEGYKIAHVINKGELVDGLAGGTCQISTTLFGASFFAGIDIVKTTPHSRPSVYTPFGFDATVVYPTTDLVLKNTYDFPVAIHYRVTNGESVVEILGKARPYSRVVFTRKVLEETPYPTEERLDDAIPDGQTVLDQAGFDGYKVERRRKFFVGKKLVKQQKWVVEYHPVTEYVRRGTDKDPDAKMPPEKHVEQLKAPSNDEWSMGQ